MEPIIPKRLLNEKNRLSIERPKKAVAYIRVSDDSQIDGESLDTQKAHIETYAKRHGLDIVKWFGDEGESAKTVNKRTEMMDMLKYCAANKGKVGYAIFYNMKRASRDIKSYYGDFKDGLRGLGYGGSFCY